MSANDANDATNAMRIEDAIDRVLDLLRHELQTNPELAYRMVKALGANVVFEGKHAANLINPIELVSSQSELEVRAQLLALPAADLKTIAKAARLATSIDLKGKSQDEIVDIVYRRAKEKLVERQS